MPSSVSYIFRRRHQHVLPTSAGFDGRLVIEQADLLTQALSLNEPSPRRQQQQQQAVDQIGQQQQYLVVEANQAIVVSGH